MSYDEAPVPDVQCGRTHRQEPHKPHSWRLQYEDDSPHVGPAWCSGYPKVSATEEDS